MNKTVEGLVSYFDVLVSKTVGKQLKDFNYKELTFEAQLVLNYLKTRNETYDGVVDDIEAVVNRMTDSMYEEEKNGNIEVAYSYSLVVTEIIFKSLQIIKEELEKLKND